MDDTSRKAGKPHMDHETTIEVNGRLVDPSEVTVVKDGPGRGHDIGGEQLVGPIDPATPANADVPQAAAMQGGATNTSDYRATEDGAFTAAADDASGEAPSVDASRGAGDSGVGQARETESEAEAADLVPGQVTADDASVRTAPSQSASGQSAAGPDEPVPNGHA